ncbi:aminoacyltransferase [Bifidobacterium sp. SO4]|uniref:aminoacyltransferase n=1 Tax=Bifidobacterium sp. SO4 TaxID=2809030 RepID=UPI001BDD8F97|nr:aminoacyltransferase [Bifidobacterium sp. SO4]MBT1170900.1 aminoacyltransferase [Bifidobacterium sp. SO4]
MTTATAASTSLKPVKITPEELDAFSAKHPQGSFQQTSQMAAMGAYSGEIDYVGVKRGGDTGELVAACYVVYTKGRLGLEGSVWCGPLCDYDDPQVVEAMTEALRRSAKAHHAISVSCWPAAVYQLHDLDGKPTSDPDTAMMENMARFGWKHGGFTVGYEKVINRWNFIKGLDGIHDEQELLASFSKYRRKNIRIAQDAGLTVRRLRRDELGTFVKLCDMSAARQGFKGRDVAYYERLFDTFGENIEFNVVETHFDEYLKTLETKLAAADKDKHNLERQLERARAAAENGEAPKKKGASDPATLEKRIATADKKIGALKQDITKVQGIIDSDGPVIPVDAGVYFWHPNEEVCLSSGEDDRFMDYYPSSLIHFHSMLDCIARGVTRFNFYGISGIFDENDPSYGVWQFKTRFGGFVEELPGKFTLPVDGLRFAAAEAAHKLLHR